MFTFAIGLLLPAQDAGGDPFSQRLEALNDLDFELRQRLAVVQQPISLLIWWHTPFCALQPAVLQERLHALVHSHPGLSVANVETMPGGLERWLLNSQLVVQINLPQKGAKHSADLLLERRLTHSLGGWGTLVQQLHFEADQSAQWLQFKGSWPYKGGQEPLHHPLRELQATVADFNAQAPGRRGLQLTSVETLQSQQAEFWARSKARQLQARSDGRLWLQTCILALILAGVRPWLQSLAPALLLLIIGVWLMSRQPLRQKAQQWCCAADGLWVQDLWHRFGVDDAPTDWMKAGQSSERSQDQDALEGMLVAHQLWLWQQPPGKTWGRSALVDAVESLRVRNGFVEASLEQHKLMRQLFVVVLAAMGMGMVAIVFLPWVLLEQLELVLAVVVVALKLVMPLPLVDAARLSQHQTRLERARQELLATQIQDRPIDADLRESVGLWIRRVGAEVLDLSADGLRSAGARQRWLP